mgnify:CR=1 FL=1
MIFIVSIEFVDNNAERDLSMDIKNLETFVMVNELKSFTQAAQRLGFTQSTVSFQIKQLENELGIPLFERISHTVTLTKDRSCFRLRIRSCGFGQKPVILQAILRLQALSGSQSLNLSPAGSSTATSKTSTTAIRESA